jgi:hypothetical protein
MEHTQGKVKHGTGLAATGGTASVHAPFGKGWPYTQIMQGYETIAILPAQDKNRTPGCNAEPDMVTTDKNARRFETLWNAADGMSNEDAVKYLEHGAEMLEYVKRWCNKCEEQGKKHHIPLSCDNCPCNKLIKQIEAS